MKRVILPRGCKNSTGHYLISVLNTKNIAKYQYTFWLYLNNLFHFLASSICFCINTSLTLVSNHYYGDWSDEMVFLMWLEECLCCTVERNTGVHLLGDWKIKINQPHNSVSIQLSKDVKKEDSNTPLHFSSILLWI